VKAVDGVRNGAKYEDAQLIGDLESLQQSLEDLGEDTKMYQILLDNEEFRNLLTR
jgi:hypothetical protein